MRSNLLVIAFAVLSICSIAPAAVAAAASESTAQGGFFSDSHCTTPLSGLTGKWNLTLPCTQPHNRHGHSIRVSCVSQLPSSEWAIEHYRHSSCDARNHNTAVVYGAGDQCIHSLKLNAWAKITCGPSAIVAAALKQTVRATPTPSPTPIARAPIVKSH